MNQKLMFSFEIPCEEDMGKDLQAKLYENSACGCFSYYDSDSGSLWIYHNENQYTHVGIMLETLTAWSKDHEYSKPIAFSMSYMDMNMGPDMFGGKAYVIHPYGSGMEMINTNQWLREKLEWIEVIER